MDPLEELMESLWVLFMRLRNQESRDNFQDDNPCERYVFFRDKSTAGNGCKYAQGCKRIFAERDKEALKKLFLKSLDLWRKVEGEDFGR